MKITIEGTVKQLANEAEKLMNNKSKAFIKLCVIGLCLDVELFTIKDKDSIYNTFKKIEKYVQKHRYSILDHGYNKRYQIILQEP